MNLDWRHYTILGLLLAVLATWASREHTHILEIEQTATTISQLNSKVVTLTSQNTVLDSSLKRSNSTRKKRTPVAIAGQIVYVEEEVSETVEDSVEKLAKSYISQVDALTAENTNLVNKLHSKETDITKSAPFWNAVVTAPIMDYGNIAGYQAGGGINIGALSLSLTNPLALSLEPRLQGMVRF